MILGLRPIIFKDMDLDASGGGILHQVLHSVMNHEDDSLNPRKWLQEVAQTVLTDFF